LLSSGLKLHKIKDDQDEEWLYVQEGEDSNLNKASFGFLILLPDQYWFLAWIKWIQVSHSNLVRFIPAWDSKHESKTSVFSCSGIKTGLQ
jgi:hypothetical protein